MSTLTTDEIWADIPEFEGRYQASNMGNIRSVDRIDAQGRNWPGRILKQSATRGGYLNVNLYMNGKSHMRRVNRLVLQAFEGDQPDLQSAHENGDRTDNRLTNLSWKTPEDNTADRLLHGTLYRTHCRRGHELTPDNLVAYDLKKGIRRCRTCERLSSARRAPKGTAPTHGHAEAEKGRQTDAQAPGGSPLQVTRATPVRPQVSIRSHTPIDPIGSPNERRSR